MNTFGHILVLMGMGAATLQALLIILATLLRIKKIDNPSTSFPLFGKKITLTFETDDYFGALIGSILWIGASLYIAYIGHYLIHY